MSKLKIIIPVIACALTLAACTPVAQPTPEPTTPAQTQSSTVTPSPEVMIERNTIVDVASKAENLTTLVSAVTTADLVETLSGAGPFTVFAPTDDAFAKVPKATLDGLLKPTAKADLTKVLAYHIVPGELMAKDLKNGQKLKTVQGEELAVLISNSNVTVGGAKVITKDMKASNGVVHIIDTVLLPKNTESTAKAPASPSGSAKASPSASASPRATSTR